MLVAVVMATLPACATARDVASDGGEGPSDRVDSALETDGPGPMKDAGPPGRDEEERDSAKQAPPVGATVTVTGAVDEVVDDNAFEIVQRDGSLEFLVLVRAPRVDVGDVVRVTGTVREQDFDALAAELDFEVDEDLYSPADPQQVLVAESVEVIEAGR
ncbi:MAG TPA: hypothetical protein VGR26_09730 [Acidimicrobiales bacterium]|nr:hypothetical protein [Acidimicrobiales bacterium]